MFLREPSFQDTDCELLAIAAAHNAAKRVLNLPSSSTAFPSSDTRDDFVKQTLCGYVCSNFSQDPNTEINKT